MIGSEPACVKARIKARNELKTVVTCTLIVTVAYLEGDFILIIMGLFLTVRLLNLNNA
jgi:hypothetical protein